MEEMVPLVVLVAMANVVTKAVEEEEEEAQALVALQVVRYGLSMVARVAAEFTR